MSLKLRVILVVLWVVVLFLVWVVRVDARDTFIAVVDVDDVHYTFIDAFCRGHQLPCRRYGGDLAAAMQAAARDNPTVSVVMWSSPHFWQPWQDGLRALSQSGPVFLPAGNSPEWRNHERYTEYAIIVGALDVTCRPKFTSPDGIELYVQATWTSWAGLFAALRYYNQEINGIPWDKSCTYKGETY